MKVWTVTYNDDYSSPRSAVFTSAEAALAAEREWVQDYRETYGDVIDFDQETDTILEALYDQAGFMDSITVEEHVLTPQREGMTRFYVSMTWDNWPEGGTYGDIIWATGYDDAKEQVIQGMINSRGGADYREDWHLIDCFPLDDFLQMAVDFPK